ncbi:ADP-ribose pyrophosphatase, mitochondrial [Anastrepha obliqua]|uniref:ADP-ribose pyrophosphatase, mitochondrial n=1 Tax=Anastrepha obliqua TaxID=95512 RepID=UPI0024092D8A|nr:ADP-ribose pyrophosphatase, mitochondrial [Anastrepha obliqua]
MFIHTHFFILLLFSMSAQMLKPGVFKHITCRNNIYPKSTVKRFSVPSEFVDWSTEYSKYIPPNYTAPHINGQPWADPDIGCENFQPKWNELDGAVNRVSLNGIYKIENEYPINSFGRTGLRGRGLLGRWGPNHAADPVVTRWQRDADGNKIWNSETKKSILQMVAIQRHDNNMWAIPGGMVDPGEKVSATLKREFMEEALDSFDNQKMIEEFFAKGVEIYTGYVDDYRNTDNAWIETVAYNFHDDNGTAVGQLKLSAGDDAANVKWLSIDSSIKLHANHNDIIEAVVTKLNAHW